MTLTPQEARELLADLEKPALEREAREYRVKTPAGTSWGNSIHASFYEAAAHLPELLRFYADNAPDEKPRTLADLPEEQRIGARIEDPQGDKGEIVGIEPRPSGRYCIRFDHAPQYIYHPWGPEELTVLPSTNAEEDPDEKPRILADLPVEQWPGTRVADLDADEGEALGRLDCSDTECCVRFDRRPTEVYSWSARDLTLVDTTSAEDTTVECGTEEITGPSTLADLDVDDWPGCYIEYDDGKSVKITRATNLPNGTHWIRARRGQITYGIPLTTTEAARTLILGRGSDRGE
ncbi:hypothetical protein [Corynebacterium sp. TAE3-ERU16]|uniref:hypothetical protein n=1 Tax=Corynebacterium sp. TAE3-ERU16 TaxID=2849493 RepID=UPI001C493ED1|nr:hypothetical protein [Corynebacterium sp. TAE3-ERU16]MBV7292352.1 hypothetical protein [Corynebacterium sp. TAE3-ERU16]